MKPLSVFLTMSLIGLNVFSTAQASTSSVDNASAVMQAMSDLGIGGYQSQPTADLAQITDTSGKTSDHLSVDFPFQHGGAVLVVNSLKVFVAPQESFLVMTYVAGQTYDTQIIKTITIQLTANTSAAQIIANVVKSKGTADTDDYSNWPIKVTSYSIGQLLCGQTGAAGAQPFCSISN